MTSLSSACLLGAPVHVETELYFDILLLKEKDGILCPTPFTEAGWTGS